MLDPRRPIILLPRDKEEQLIPYHPELVIPPPMYLNYNVTVSNYTVSNYTVSNYTVSNHGR